MPTNVHLNNARDAKNDEFYTQFMDVAKELMHYKMHFKDKIVFCNCDTTESAFWKYFHLNFAKLGLKKLISTHYDRKEVTYKMEYTGGDDNDVEAGVRTLLESNGDFRNQECLDLLDECDIVVTNPPFSLFLVYMQTLIDYKKKFIIIGNRNALGNNIVFDLIKNDKVWVGFSSTHHMFFEVPKWYAEHLKSSSDRKEGHGQSYLMVNGKVMAEVNACWYTNLDISKRHEKLILRKTYNEKDFSKYDNCEAIDVSKTSNIPLDYNGVMGVPITFLEKYNPEQFEIIGKNGTLKINGKNIYTRILIRKKVRI